MLTGPDLGAALKRAIELKLVSQSAVAREFGIKQPSVSEWIRYGRIGKRHIPHLVAYFAGVVRPEHWGLPASWAAGMAPSSSAIPTEQPRPIYGVPPPVPNRRFEDRREVSETDWAVLQAVKLVLPEPELERIKSEAERIRRMAAEQIEAANDGRASPDKE